MTKAVRLNLTKRQIRLAESLRSGHRDFDELKEENKMRVAAIPYDMSGIVDEEKLERYRMKKKIEEADSFGKRQLLRARLMITNGR